MNGSFSRCYRRGMLQIGSIPPPSSQCRFRLVGIHSTCWSPSTNSNISHKDRCNLCHSAIVSRWKSSKICASKIRHRNRAFGGAVIWRFANPLLVVASTERGGYGVLGFKCFTAITSSATAITEGSGLLIFIFLIIMNAEAYFFFLTVAELLVEIHNRSE